MQTVRNRVTSPWGGTTNTCTSSSSAAGDTADISTARCIDGPDALSLAAFGLHVHERIAYVCDFTAWWLHDVRVEKWTDNRTTSGRHRYRAASKAPGVVRRQTTPEVPRDT
ncbi:hypothetical protein PPGU19_091450 (plasmid) [Paraburkholderia sp. PGU19]|nr:hypothetical protein PPGU19_091450 [Paraburkholderia sp. PGU19]